MALWQVYERLQRLDVETAGASSEAWVRLVGVEGTTLAFPLSVLFEAANLAQGVLLNHAENSPGGLISSVISPDSDEVSSGGLTHGHGVSGS